MKTLSFWCRIGIALATILVSGSAFAQCGVDVNYNLINCVNEGKETEVDNDTCADPGPPDYYCVQGYGTCTDGTIYHTANAGCSDSCGDGCYGGGGGDGGGGGGCYYAMPRPGHGVVGGDDCDDSFRRVPGVTPSLGLPVAGGYYRNWQVSDDLPVTLLHARKAAAAANVSLKGQDYFGGEPVKTPAILLAGICGVAPALCAQQGAAQAVDLKTIKIELPLSHPTQMIDKIACDSEGDIYARVWAGDESLTTRLPVREITPDGVLGRNFGVTDASQNTDLAKGIFVSRTGDLYQVARTASGVYAVEFAKDGSVKSATKLEADPRLDPWQLAVFKTGGFLLTGLTGRDRRAPYTAVFDANGKLVKKIYEPEDEEARLKAEGGDIEYTNSNVGNRFVGAGDVAAAEDGNVYLLRGTSPALVYVVSPAGDVVRKLHIDAGDPDLVAGDIKSYAGRLAIGFRGSNNLVVVTDLQGKTLASYTVDRHKPDLPALACFDSSGFTFATVYAEKGLYLLKAKLP
jgi:hypothetical protein